MMKSDRPMHKHGKLESEEKNERIDFGQLDLVEN